MPLDPQAVTVLKAMEEDGFILSPDMTPAEMRNYSIQSQQAIEPAEVGRVENRVIAGPDGNDLPLRIYWPHGAGAGGNPLGVVVYFHGGGWVLCDLETHDPQVRSMVNRTGLVHVSVDYRLAPEHPYPAGPDDCYAAMCWVAANAAELGVDPSRLAVAGDSAGGNLAAVTALMARDRGGPEIAFQLLVYPCCDMDPRRLVVHGRQRRRATSHAGDHGVVLRPLHRRRRPDRSVHVARARGESCRSAAGPDHHRRVRPAV